MRIMWTLWIISNLMVNGIEEPKWTVYDIYKDQMECYQQWYKVSSEFTEGEVAFCGLTT